MLSNTNLLEAQIGIENNENTDKSDDYSTYLAIPFENGQVKLLDNVLTVYDRWPEIATKYQELSGSGVESHVNTEVNNAENGSGQEKPIAASDKSTNVEKRTENTILICDKCNAEFPTPRLFRKHQLWHRNMKKFECTQCKAAFNIENNLKVHLMLHDTGNPVCTICGASFHRTASLKSHILIHQVEEVVKCDECKSEFNTEEELVKHVQVHVTKSKISDVKSLICPYCKVKYENSTVYKEHVSSHVKMKKMVLNKSSKRQKKADNGKEYAHKCMDCGKTFPKASLLIRHERIHTGYKPFKCNICQKAFAQKGTLTIHLTKHTGQKKFACTLCPAKFSQKSNFRSHVEKTHTAPTSEEKIYKCNQCDCIFKKVASLNGHITKVHTDTELTEIDEVMSNLKQLSSIVSKKSDKEVPSKGEVTEGFVRLSESRQDGNIRKYLVKMKKIDDIRWYCCNYCSKQFKKPSDMIRHIRVHTKEKPFECKQCNSKFALKSTLMGHIKVHSLKQEYYFCSKCNISYSNARSLRLHLKKHDKNHRIQYQCTICNNTYDTMDEANPHRLEHTIFASDSLPDCIKPILKQPLVVTPHGGLPPKPPKKKMPNTGIEDPKVRPHECSLCKARFTKSDNLKRHLKCHRNERSHRCHICQKAFISAYRLSEHIKYHKNIREFHCDTCSKRFVNSTLLKRHQLVHNNEKQYLCAYCNSRFKTLLLARSHVRKMHKAQVALQMANASPGEIKIDDIEFNSDFSCNIRSQFEENTVIQESVPSSSLNTAPETLITPSLNQLSNLNQVIEAPNVTENNIASTATDQIYPLLINLDLQISDQYSSAISTSVIQTSKSLQSNDLILNLMDNNFDSNQIQIRDNNILTPDNVILQNQLDPASMLKPNKDNPESLDNNLNLSGMNNNGSVILYGNESVQNIIDFEPTKTNMTVLNPDLRQNIIDSNTQIICLICGKSFGNIGQFQGHGCNVDTINNAPEPEIVENTKAADSNKEIDSQNNETENSEDESKNRTYECVICRKLYNVRKAYLKHMQSHSDKISVKTCNFCGKRFKKPSDLIRHLRTHTGEKPFGCTVCQKKFALKSTLESHMRTHDPITDEEKFHCQVCDSGFTTKSSLKQHMLIHSGKKLPHVCTYCAKSFRSAKAKKTHEFSQHVQKNESLKETKSKVTQLLNSVAEEILLNNGANESTSQNQQEIPQLPLIVEEPNNSIKSNQQELNILNVPPEIQEEFLQQLQNSGLLIQNATDITTEAESNQTPLFLTGFSLINVRNDDQIDMKAVDNKQTNDINSPEKEKVRKHECDICQKRFFTKDVLRKHQKTHLEYSKFPCIKCNRGFSKQHALNRHLTTHETSRPFACDLCDNSFSSVKNLKAHKKRIHRDIQDGTNVDYFLKFD